MNVSIKLNIVLMYFYEKPLSELTDEEWEKICMKCGKCCMCKYSDGEVIHFSNQMCKFFDVKKGICSCYSDRLDIADGECKKISLELLEKEISLLPPSCAYRRLYEGRGLPEYHPLVTGNPKSAIEAGQTVKSLKVFSEKAQNEAVQALAVAAVQEQWTEAKIKQKLSKICKKFALKWLETYPYVTNIKEPAV